MFWDETQERPRRRRRDSRKELQKNPLDVMKREQSSKLPIARRVSPIVIDGHSEVIRPSPPARRVDEVHGADTDATVTAAAAANARPVVPLCVDWNGGERLDGVLLVVPACAVGQLRPLSAVHSPNVPLLSATGLHATSVE